MSLLVKKLPTIRYEFIINELFKVYQLRAMKLTPVGGRASTARPSSGLTLNAWMSTHYLTSTTMMLYFFVTSTTSRHSIDTWTSSMEVVLSWSDRVRVVGDTVTLHLSTWEMMQIGMFIQCMTTLSTTPLLSTKEWYCNDRDVNESLFRNW